MRRTFLISLVLLLLSACGGRSGDDGTVKVEGPEFEPRRVAIETLEPGPTLTPTQPPTPTPAPTPTPVPVGPPRGATLASAAGRQSGNVASYCWAEHVGGSCKRFNSQQTAPAQPLVVRSGEKTLLRIDVDLDPDDEFVRPFEGSRSGHPSQPIDPARETDLTIDLPKGPWQMDVCATWHGRGQPICWLFRLDVI
jgi:hypothetical protein